MTTTLLLCCALSMGQTPDRAEWLLAPHYFDGLELVYKGSCTEESLVPGVQRMRQYHLETSFLIQETLPRHWEAALQTSLTLVQPKTTAKGAPTPGSVRLEQVRVDYRGGLRSKQDKSIAIPLTGLPLVETGAFFELPSVHVNMQSYWEATDEGRPLRGWQVLGVEQRVGTSCLKLLGSQQSTDWNEPRADSTAWRRKDVIWFAPQLGMVYRVERTIEHRGPARQDPTQRTVVVYELDSKMKYSGRFLEDRKDEIAKTRKFIDDAAPLLAQPVQYRSHIAALQRRIDYFLEHNAPTPYRKALAHLQSRLEHGRQAELGNEPIVEETAAVREPARIGEKVPDFVITDITCDKSRRFYQYLGQSILVLYYNPNSDSGRDALRFCQRLYHQHGADLLVLGMAVSDDVDAIRKQHENLGLTFPILDGRAMHRTFGVEGTPRVVLLDGDGLVRAAFTGWGYHIPDEIEAELHKLLPK